MRAGAVMLVGVAAVNGGNYLFQLVAARKLGPEAYGDLVALLTLSSLVSLPFTALQVVVGRYVARFMALGQPASANRLNRRMAVGTAALAAATTIAILALTPLIQRWLSISSGWAVVLTALLTLPSALTPVVWGVVQGLQRFSLLSFSMALGTVVRLAALAAFVVAALSASTAVVATLIGMVASVVVPLAVVHGWFRPSASAESDEAHVGRLLRTTAPAAVALLAFTSLTQTDVLAANTVFSDTASGVYSAASLIGRLILYLPAAVVAVLLPKVAERAASNRETRDILGMSLLTTFGFCALCTVVYAALPGTIVDLAFGSKYTDAKELLLPFGVAMTALALINVLLYYHLGRDENFFTWILSGAAITQVAAFALFHGSPRQLIVDTIVVSVLALACHEATTRLAMIHATRNAAVQLLRRGR